MTDQTHIAAAEAGHSAAGAESALSPPWPWPPRRRAPNRVELQMQLGDCPGCALQELHDGAGVTYPFFLEP